MHDSLTATFIEHWENNGILELSGVAAVLTPGLFAEFLPNCFADGARMLERAGLRVLRSRPRTRATVMSQAAQLNSSILNWLRPAEDFVWCTHSKGGIDAMAALTRHKQLSQRCKALVLCQPPIGGSWILNRCLHTPSGLREHMTRYLLRSPLGRGCLDITDQRPPQTQCLVDRFVPPVPILQVVSWSTTPTHWLDAYHERLNALRPGWAHDGQFFVDDQIAPNTGIVGLPRLDHAQPVLGGHGLDVGRLWKTLLQTVLTDHTK